MTCGRKEKQENKIEENLSLEKRKKEKMPARRRNSIGLKDNSPDKLRLTYLRSQMHISKTSYCTMGNGFVSLLVSVWEERF